MESQVKPKTKFLSRRKFILTSVAAALTEAFLIEPNLSSITYRDVRVPYLPPSLNGLRVIHLTDFHYKPDKDESLMEGIIKKVNALKPDLILLTGDYIDGDNPEVDPLINQLKSLKAKHGIFASMGNHDGWQNSGDHYRKRFEAIDTGFLINQNTHLSIKGESLYVAGSDFVWNGKPNPAATLKGIPPLAALITLVHEPDYFDTMLRHRDHHLQLSGHTHGGQCRVPLINYAPKKVSYGKKYIYDTYKQKDSSIWVSKGIGTTGIRVRFSCLPEIAVLTLRG